MRRYVRANRLKRLWTLTYRRVPADRAGVIRDLRQFFERVRFQFGKLPLVAVVERGDLRGRLHVHFAADRFLPIRKMYRCWPHGNIDIGDPGRLAGRVGVRQLAAYLAKYVAKQVDDGDGQGEQCRAEGEHRYLVSQGFTPTAYRLRYGTFTEAHERMLGLYGQPDVAIAFGDWDTDPAYGMWFSFPDHVLHPSPLEMRRKPPP